MHKSLLIHTWLLIAAIQSVSVGWSAQIPANEKQFALDLSGEWEFKLDPLDVGRAQEWFRQTVPFERKLQVPGAWNTQGVAYESESVLREYEAKLLIEQKQLYGLGTLGKEGESAKLFSA